MAHQEVTVLTARERWCHVGHPCSRAVFGNPCYSPGVLQVENEYGVVIFNSPSTPVLYPHYQCGQNTVNTGTVVQNDTDVGHPCVQLTASS